MLGVDKQLQLVQGNAGRVDALQLCGAVADQSVGLHRLDSELTIQRKVNVVGYR